MRPITTKFVSVIFLLSSLFLNIQAEELKSSEPCDFPAIFNFGDSNSDTGSMSAAFYPAALPSGETFFHEAVGRGSDGRLIIDFIAKHLGFPFLSAYINSIGTSFKRGANFAAGSSTIMRQNRTYWDGGTPFTLEVQAIQFNNFKTRTAKFFNQGKGNSYARQYPRPEDFAKAIYTFDIGQNDIAAIINKGLMEDHKAISDSVELFKTQIQTILWLGGRTFWIHNTGPIGCLPVDMPVHNAFNNFTQTPGYVDQNGCVNYQNDMVKEFNAKLKIEVEKLRVQFPDASFIYVDMFSAKYQLISNAKKQGFLEASEICCGYHKDGYHVYCGNKQMINGKEVIAGSCEYPSKYISWDGVHYTDAANRWIANRIINGAFSDPPLSIKHSCQTKVGGNKMK